MIADDVNIKIGEKIKDLRNANGLTQQELADRTELTKGYISQLERGLTAPSVVTLLDIIECLGSSPAEFFQETQEEHIVYKDGNYFEKVDEAGNITEWLIPTAQKNMMEPLRITLMQGERTPQDKPHEGEEFGYVISGKIKIHLGEKVYTAGTGESFYYKCDKSHYLECISKKAAKVIWVSTPPSF